MYIQCTHTFIDRKLEILILVNCVTNFTFLQGETGSDDGAELNVHDLEMSSSEEEEGETTKTTRLSTNSNSVVKLIIMFLMFWETMHNISDSAISLLFAFSKKVIELLAKISQSKAIKDIANLLPNCLYMIDKELFGYKERGLSKIRCLSKMFGYLQTRGLCADSGQRKEKRKTLQFCGISRSP